MAASLQDYELRATVLEEGAMYGMRHRQDIPESPDNIVQFRPYQQEAARRRRRAWWAALVGLELDKPPRPKPDATVSSGDLVRFRGRLGAARR